MSSNDELNRQVSKLFRTYKTVKEMCKDRGYLISDLDLQMTLQEFKNKHCDSMGNPVRKTLSFKTTPTEESLAKFPSLGELWVEFNDEMNVGIKTMKNFIIHLTENKISNGIFIYQLGITSSAMKLIPTVSKDLVIECFHETNLIVNITKHVLVPNHLKLNLEEKNELLKTYRLKESQLPRIQKSDPIALYLGLKRGDVVKIIRNSETSGRYASYRICL
ncbi:hypothetical protein QEN19_004090 [Hanseniaspora menglaensis]